MNKYYFSAKIQQEFADIICKKALDLGVPKENIVLEGENCKLLHVNIYIKFNDIDTYEKFRSWDVPGIVEIF